MDTYLSVNIYYNYRGLDFRVPGEARLMQGSVSLFACCIRVGGAPLGSSLLHSNTKHQPLGKVRIEKHNYYLEMVFLRRPER